MPDNTAKNTTYLPANRMVEEILAWEEYCCINGISGINMHLWTPQKPAIALGISQLPERELHVSSVQTDGCSIVRRPSGGGAVVLLDGVLAFGVMADPAIFTDKYAIHEAFDRLTLPVRDAVAEIARLPKSAVIAGISDLAVETSSGLRKICGCAQMRKKNAVLVHGTILVHADLDLLEKYLSWPSEVPDYRQGRSHKDFCVNISDICADHTTVGHLSELITAKAVESGWNITGIPDNFPKDCCKLFTEKYCQSSWNIERRRPAL